MQEPKMNYSIPKPLNPPRLEPGDKIGIVAPASPFDQDKFDQGIDVLKAMGFEPVFPESLFKKERYLAGSDQHRAELFNRFFEDDEIQAIVCARGGYGSMRMLKGIDFQLIRERPKLVVGFSDATALLWSLYQQCGLQTLHGPTITTLGHADSLTRTSLFTALTSSQQVTLEVSDGKTIQAGSATGIVAGGNLTTLCHLVGTPFAPLFNNHIVLLEDRGEAPYRIDRMLSQMKMADSFNGAAGIVLGSFEGCGSVEEIHTIVKEVFRPMQIPILSGFEVGHGDRNLVVPLGSRATLDTQQGRLSYHDPSTLKDHKAD
jgi:muramoyltetrapeptide carboxypeptidase